jgi:hypothetical protein
MNPEIIIFKANFISSNENLNPLIIGKLNLNEIKNSTRKRSSNQSGLKSKMYYPNSTIDIFQKH